MQLLTWLLHVFLLFRTILGSPFEITDNYINEYAKAIDELKKINGEITYHEGTYDPTKYNEAEALKEAHQYDFIVVGSGSAGSVVASRLSEVPEWKVLLLEAGGPETKYTEIPVYHPLLQATPYNWGYTTIPQKTWCLGKEDHKCIWASGKALGGSTVINSMMYTRGNKIDYDKWADQGNDGWCYDDVLPYFKKSENAHLHLFDRKFHSQGGPVQVEDVQHQSPMVDLFLEAGKEVGLDTIDYNGKEQIGVGPTQLTTKHGKRNSFAKAYLEPAKTRKNLVVQPLSHVTEILIAPHTKEAYGVKYLHDGKLFVAKASKEVILSAGAFNSPQLLMLSGVGPKEDLEHLEIPVIQDLKVGHNLKDHISFIGLTFIANKTHPEESNLHNDLVKWLREGKGPMSAVNSQALGYIKTKLSKEKTALPDIELVFSPRRHDSYEKVKVFRIKKEIYDSVWKPIEGETQFFIDVMLPHPESTGILKLKSKDPLNWPLLDANQLSDPDDHDIATMVEGIKKAIEITKTGAFQKIGAHLNPHPMAGCEKNEFASDDYWKCAIRHLAITLRHHCGTCKMGPHTDKDAVVDNKLKVHGIHKLRVADTSVIPVTITGHTNAPAIMIGEKAADLIKAEWK